MYASATCATDPFEIDLEHHEATVEVDGTRHTLVRTLTKFKLLAQLARAPSPACDRSLHEAARLADNFNALASEPQRVTEEPTFWNVAVAHAHRGEAVCMPAPGGGTRFDVCWPDDLTLTPDERRFPAQSAATSNPLPRTGD